MIEKVIYNKIGQGYNRTRKADPYITHRLFTLLAADKGKRYLDIGCGTGNYTIALADAGLNMTGVDPSHIMLEEAKSKSNKIEWLYGTAEDINLVGGPMDGAIATFTLHHWSDLEKGFSNVARLLKPGAFWVILTFTPEQEHGYWLNHFFPGMMRKSGAKAIPFTRVINAAAGAGFTIVDLEKYYVQPDLQDLFMYSGKHDPEIYFDPAVRNGISAFAALSDASEVEGGLAKLRQCIDNGTFDTIKKQYENDNGDYLFVVLRKNG